MIELPCGEEIVTTDDILRRFDTIPEHDGQRNGRTDGRTDGQTDRIPISISRDSVVAHPSTVRPAGRTAIISI